MTTWLRLFLLLGFLGLGLFQTQAFAGDARIERCPDARYNGPVQGEHLYKPDQYIWFVSAEFAKRFCMPEAYIEPSLKGAMAIAARLVPNAEVLCNIYNKGDRCNGYEHLWLEVYVDNRTANIPKADPSVSFYEGRLLDYSHQMFAQTHSPRSKLEGEGKYQRHVGMRRPFFLYPTDKDIHGYLNTQFEYLGVRDGWASDESGLIENYYEQDWVPGIDVIGLDYRFIGWGHVYDPKRTVDYYPNDPVQRHVIATAKGADLRTNGGTSFDVSEFHRKNKLFPRVYTHVIEVPPRLVAFIKKARERSGRPNLPPLYEPTQVAPQAATPTGSQP